MARGLRILMVVILVTPLVHAMAAPDAQAGGSWLDPVKDRYEVGEEVTLIGYPGAAPSRAAAEGPFLGYLYREMDDWSGSHPRAIPLPVGELQISDGGSPGFPTARVSITFTLPMDLRPGIYRLDYCNAGCEKLIGDLLGGFFYVGRDAEYPVSREWPLTEPQIENLANDALISRFGGNVVRAGEVNLSRTYKECLADAGFEVGGAQVLLNDDAIPYHVKTGIDVPNEFHGPCFAVVGGAPTSGSSWSASWTCDESPVSPPCD